MPQPVMAAGSGAGVFLTFQLLLVRAWREQTRNVKALIFKLSMNLFFVSLFGMVYFQVGPGRPI